MDLLQMKRELAVKGKNGIAFLTAGTAVWVVITIIFILPLGARAQDLFAFYATGLTFPLAVVLSKWLGADWRVKGNALGSLGLYLNLAQLMYFPLLFWAIVRSPSEMVLLFAIITGAHFYPYGWLYDTKVYYFFAPIVTVSFFGIGLIHGVKSWMIPFVMVIFLVIINVFLFLDYQHKRRLL